MTSLWSAILLILQVMNANREPWVEPLPGVRMEPIRPARHEKDFGPDSAYRLLIRAGELPVEDEALSAVMEWLATLADHALPKEAMPGGGDPPSWSDDERSAVRELLVAVGPDLALARRAAAAPDPQVPTRDWSAKSSRYLADARTVGRLFALAAYSREGEGDPAGALDELLTCIRFGGILSRGGPLLGHLVDMRISRLAADPIWRIATRHELPSPVLRRAAKQLLELADQTEPFAEAVRQEALNIVSLSDQVHTFGPNWLRNEPPPRPMLKWVLLEGFYWLTGSSRTMVRRDLELYSRYLVKWAAGPHCAAVAARARWSVGWTSDEWLPRTLLSARDPVGCLHPSDRLQHGRCRRP